MKVRKNELIKRVLRYLDEEDDELERAMVYGDAGCELRRLAGDILPEGIRKELLEAAPEEIDEALTIVNPVIWKGDTGELRLPADFLRLVELRMKGWTAGVGGFSEPELIPAESWGGEVLRHHPRGPVAIAAARYKPAVTLCCDGASRCLRIYGAVPGMPAETASYLAAPDPDADSFEIPKALVGKVARITAGMIKDIIYG